MTPDERKRLIKARDELLRIEGELRVLETAWRGTVADVQANISLTMYRLRDRVAAVRVTLDAPTPIPGGEP